MKKIRFGTLSTAKIGVEKVIPAMQQGQRTEVTAIASRDLAKAKKAASELNIQKAFGSYEELLSDPDVDAVYIPLPNHLHVQWSIKAMQAGKHVLCEKPVGMSAGEARELLAESRKHPRLKVMEAFMYRHHPRWIRTKELVEDGAIGELRTIHSFFTYSKDDPGNIRFKPDMGGGALMDIGCYNISLSRFLFGSQPDVAGSVIRIHPEYNVDVLASGLLDFGSGTSTFTCSMQTFAYQSVQILGTEGRIDMDWPFNTPPDKPTKLVVNSKGASETLSFEPCNQYTLQGDRFTEAIFEDRDVPTPLEDAVENMNVLEAVVRVSL